ncbi:MAG: TonB-dependent receptor plug domain-containing protein [Spirochaetota bacterium]
MLKRFTLFLCAAVFSSFLFTGRLQAHEEETKIEVEEIVVTATRVETSVLDAPAHITIITEEEIARFGARNFAEIINRHAGVTINDYGPEGSLKSASIRGSDSSGVLVLIDGIRINDSRQSGVDLSLIPIDMIERVEIIRGGTSALYGADAVGGVINIITKKKADNILNISIQNGSYIPRKAFKVYEGDVREKVNASMLDLLDTQKVTLGYSRELGKASVVTAGSFTRANNAFVWKDDEYINDYRKRINADLLGGDIYTSLTLPAFGGNFDLTGMLGYSKRGVPGVIDPLSFALSTDATQKNTNTNIYARYNTNRFISDLLTLDAKVFYRFSSLGYKNPDELYPEDSLHKTHSAGIDISQELIAFENIAPIYGGNLYLDLLDSTDIGTKERVSGGIFLEVPIYPFQRLTIIPSIRYDIYSDFPDNFSYKLDGVYSLSETASLKAGFAKSYRAPSMNDLYWPSDPYVEGNPDLKPETGYNGEIGISVRKNALSFDLFAFTRYMYDKIEWTSGPDYVWRPYNIGESFYTGSEAEGSMEVIKGLWFNLSYTLTYSFVLKGKTESYSISDDKRVPFVPLHSLNGSVRYSPGKNNFTLGARAESKRFIDEANTESTDPYMVLNASYSRAFSDDLSITVAVDNLLNSNYEIMDGYIMPPLFIRAGLEASFR